MKIYISGQITGLDPTIAAANFEAAEQLITDAGFEAINPMKKVSEQQGYSWQKYMREDIKILMDCDGIYLMTGWSGSRGAEVERNVAMGIRMPTISEWQDLGDLGYACHLCFQIFPRTQLKQAFTHECKGRDE